MAREPNLTTESLRQYLKQQLPEYMVPQAMVLLPRLPLTANGKIDRQALPEPEQLQTKAYVAPRTPTEEVVAGIWSEVLRRDRISTHDNFFDLGGHSLLATQVISRIRRGLNVDLPLRMLFEHATVAQLAGQIDKVQRNQQGVSASPMVRVSATRRSRSRSRNSGCGYSINSNPTTLCTTSRAPCGWRAA